jgi:hypothetical protein
MRIDVGSEGEFLAGIEADFSERLIGLVPEWRRPQRRTTFMHDLLRIYPRNADPKDGRSAMILFSFLFASSLITAAMILASAHLTVLAHPR